MSQSSGMSWGVAGEDPINLNARLTGWAKWLAWGRMTKPRITVMVVLVTAVGFLMGRPVSDGATWWTLLATLVGMALSCMSASVLNQVFERDADALMDRTKNRPVPTGGIAVIEALVGGVALFVVGVMVLGMFTNPLTVGLSAFTVISYALVYTPMKRISSTSTLIGAVPGALPPVMGYTAATGVVGVEAWLMFAILYVWQLPHFLAIAWLYRQDYARAGMAVLPVVHPDGHSTFRQMLIGSAVLLPLGLMPAVLGVSGVVYFLGALVLGVGMLVVVMVAAAGRSHRWARVMFLTSVVYLPLIFMLMLLDRV